MHTPTVLDISQTNLANFGTDLEYKIKKAAAEGEPAFKRFVSTTANIAGTFLWRVHNFKLEEVCGGDGNIMSEHTSGAQTANFFRGDCYLALHVRPKAIPNIYYWIGDSSSIDEAGTCAYKAFELDNILGMRARQYREVCGNETDAFRALFPGMRILDGGYDSGFHHVSAGSHHQTRLLRVYADKVVEVPMDGSSLRSNGVFILDAGLQLYQWTGANAPISLRAPAMKAVRALDDERGSGVEIFVLTEVSTSGPADIMFLKTLNSEGGPYFDDSATREVSTEAARIIAWDGTTFHEVPRYEGGISIHDEHTRCTVYGPLPQAALCSMAYFTWAKKDPVHTVFVTAVVE